MKSGRALSNALPLGDQINMQNIPTAAPDGSDEMHLDMEVRHG